MKRLIAAAAVLVISVILTVCSTMVVKNKSNEVNEKINTIKQNAKQSTSGGEEEEFQKYWEKNEESLSVFINHTDLNDIGLAAARMASAAKVKKYEDVLESANEISFIIENITEDEQLHWFSFF